MQLPPDVSAFRTLWLPASKIEATERPNPTIQAALDCLAVGIRRRVLLGATDEVAVSPFDKAIPHPKDFAESDPSTINAHTLKDGDRLLVNVHLGSASSVYAFDKAGHAFSVPTAYHWSYRYRGPFHRIGDLILFDAVAIQDAGTFLSFHLVAHRGRRLGNRKIPRKPGWADNIRRGRGWVQLDDDALTLRFDLATVRGETIVRSVQCRG